MKTEKFYFAILLTTLLVVSLTYCAASQTTRALLVEDNFYPSGWMGDMGDIAINPYYHEGCHSPPNCTEMLYTAERSHNAGWAGIYWQYPRDNWGSMPGLKDIFTDAKRLTFWAKGKVGGEKAEFKVGGISGEYYDSLRPAKSTGLITLTPEWMQYSIDLRGRDLSHVIGGFCWVAEAVRNPAGSTIYVDDIQYEWD